MGGACGDGDTHPLGPAGHVRDPAARRRPWNVARQAVGIDQLSEGRMVLGVGLGDTGEAIGADASFTRLGEEVAPRRGAQILDEALEIIAGLWAGEPFAFRGSTSSSRR